MIEIIFVLAITVVSALLAVSSRNIVYGVVFLLCTNVSLGIVYYMIGAPTVALFQLAIPLGVDHRLQPQELVGRGDVADRRV